MIVIRKANVVLTANFAGMVERTADDFAPVYLLMVLSAISFLAVVRIPETAAQRNTEGPS